MCNRGLELQNSLLHRLRHCVNATRRNFYFFFCYRHMANKDFHSDVVHPCLKKITTAFTPPSCTASSRVGLFKFIRTETSCTLLLWSLIGSQSTAICYGCRIVNWVTTADRFLENYKCQISILSMYSKLAMKIVIFLIVSFDGGCGRA